MKTTTLLLVHVGKYMRTTAQLIDWFTSACNLRREYTLGSTIERIPSWFRWRRWLRSRPRERRTAVVGQPGWCADEGCFTSINQNLSDLLTNLTDSVSATLKTAAPSITVWCDPCEIVPRNVVMFKCDHSVDRDRNPPKEWSRSNVKTVSLSRFCW